MSVPPGGHQTGSPVTDRVAVAVDPADRRVALPDAPGILLRHTGSSGMVQKLRKRRPVIARIEARRLCLCSLVLFNGIVPGSGSVGHRCHGSGDTSVTPLRTSVSSPRVIRVTGDRGVIGQKDTSVPGWRTCVSLPRDISGTGSRDTHVTRDIGVTGCRDIDDLTGQR